MAVEQLGVGGEASALRLDPGGQAVASAPAPAIIEMKLRRGRAHLVRDLGDFSR
jgi:hypothetical protein